MYSYPWDMQQASFQAFGKCSIEFGAILSYTNIREFYDEQVYFKQDECILQGSTRNIPSFSHTETAGSVAAFILT